MVLYGFIGFYMVLYGFIWFYNRPLKQDMSKPITCDVTGKKFRISSSSNRDSAVQWWVTTCWRVNLTVKHVGKSWWKLTWVLFATTQRERDHSQLAFIIYGEGHIINKTMGIMWNNVKKNNDCPDVYRYVQADCMFHLFEGSSITRNAS